MMLDFLDSFRRVLATRDRTAIHRLLRHPLARALPPVVRAEARAIARAGPAGRLPPVRLLHFYYQTLQLLGTSNPSGASYARREMRPNLPARAPRAAISV